MKLNEISITILILLMANCAHPDERRTAVVEIPPISNTWSWATKEWSGNDKPFRDLRAQVDEEFNKQKLQEVLDRYKVSAKKNPADERVRFAWLYAAYRVAQVESSVGERSLLEAIEDLDAVPSPNSYEYMRMRFLAIATIYPYPQLRHIGEKLAGHASKDYEVRYQLIKVINKTLIERADANDKKMAVKYAQELLDIDPINAKGYAILGAIYFRSWFNSKSRADENDAIKAYNQYLKLAPFKDPFREQAKRLIRFIQSR